MPVVRKPLLCFFLSGVVFRHDELREMARAQGRRQNGEGKRKV